MMVNSRHTKQVIVMRKDLGMRKGKMIAQGAHAAMAFITRQVRDNHLTLTEAERHWLDHSFVKICVGVDSEEELLAIYERAMTAGVTTHLITDAGLTEFAGVPTNTCCSVGPDWNDRVDAITGDLKLL